MSQTMLILLRPFRRFNTRAVIQSIITSAKVDQSNFYMGVFQNVFNELSDENNDFIIKKIFNSPFPILNICLCFFQNATPYIFSKFFK